MRTRILMSVALFVLLVGIAISANAGIQQQCTPTANYTVSGGFADGGTFGGQLISWQFQLPQNLPCYDYSGTGGFNISVSYGAFSAFDYYALPSGNNSIVNWSFYGNELILDFYDELINNNGRYLQLAFDPTNLVYGGSVSLDYSNSFEADGIRNITSGGVSPGLVPEPSSLLLLGSGAVGLAAVIRRRLLG